MELPVANDAGFLFNQTEVHFSNVRQLSQARKCKSLDSQEAACVKIRTLQAQHVIDNGMLESKEDRQYTDLSKEDDDMTGDLWKVLNYDPWKGKYPRDYYSRKENDCAATKDANKEDDYIIYDPKKYKDFVRSNTLRNSNCTNQDAQLENAYSKYDPVVDNDQTTSGPLDNDQTTSEPLDNNQTTSGPLDNNQTTYNPCVENEYIERDRDLNKCMISTKRRVTFCDGDVLPSVPDCRTEDLLVKCAQKKQVYGRPQNYRRKSVNKDKGQKIYSWPSASDKISQRRDTYDGYTSSSSSDSSRDVLSSVPDCRTEDLLVKRAQRKQVYGRPQNIRRKSLNKDKGQKTYNWPSASYKISQRSDTYDGYTSSSSSDSSICMINKPLYDYYSSSSSSSESSDCDDSECSDCIHENDMPDDELPCPPALGQLKMNVQWAFNVLIVRVYNGRGIRRSPSLFRQSDKSNLYIKIALDARTFRSISNSILISGTDCPEFNQEFSFDLNEINTNSSLFVSVWDRDSEIHQDFIGAISVDLVRSNWGIHGWFDLALPDINYLQSVLFDCNGLTDCVVAKNPLKKKSKIATALASIRTKKSKKELSVISGQSRSRAGLNIRERPAGLTNNIDIHKRTKHDGTPSNLKKRAEQKWNSKFARTLFKPMKIEVRRSKFRPSKYATPSIIPTTDIIQEPQPTLSTPVLSQPPLPTPVSSHKPLIIPQAIHNMITEMSVPRVRKPLLLSVTLKPMSIEFPNSQVEVPAGISSHNVETAIPLLGSELISENDLLTKQPSPLMNICLPKKRPTLPPIRPYHPSNQQKFKSSMSVNLKPVKLEFIDSPYNKTREIKLLNLDNAVSAVTEEDLIVKEPSLLPKVVKQPSPGPVKRRPTLPPIRPGKKSSRCLFHSTTSIQLKPKSLVFDVSPDKVKEDTNQPKFNTGGLSVIEEVISKNVISIKQQCLHVSVVSEDIPELTYKTSDRSHQSVALDNQEVINDLQSNLLRSYSLEDISNVIGHISENNNSKLEKNDNDSYTSNSIYNLISPWAKKSTSPAMNLIKDERNLDLSDCVYNFMTPTSGRLTHWIAPLSRRIANSCQNVKEISEEKEDLNVSDCMRNLNAFMMTVNMDISDCARNLFTPSSSRLAPTRSIKVNNAVDSVNEDLDVSDEIYSVITPIHKKMMITDQIVSEIIPPNTPERNIENQPHHVLHMSGVSRMKVAERTPTDRALLIEQSNTEISTPKSALLKRPCPKFWSGGCRRKSQELEFPNKSDYTLGSEKNTPKTPKFNALSEPRYSLMNGASRRNMLVRNLFSEPRYALKNNESQLRTPHRNLLSEPRYAIMSGGPRLKTPKRILSKHPRRELRSGDYQSKTPQRDSPNPSKSTVINKEYEQKTPCGETLNNTRYALISGGFRFRSDQNLLNHQNRALVNEEIKCELSTPQFAVMSECSQFNTPNRDLQSQSRCAIKSRNSRFKTPIRDVINQPGYALMSGGAKMKTPDEAINPGCTLMSGRAQFKVRDTQTQQHNAWINGESCFITPTRILQDEPRCAEMSGRKRERSLIPAIINVLDISINNALNQKPEDDIHPNCDSNPDEIIMATAEPTQLVNSSRGWSTFQKHASNVLQTFVRHTATSTKHSHRMRSWVPDARGRGRVTTAVARKRHIVPKIPKINDEKIQEDTEYLPVLNSNPEKPVDAQVKNEDTALTARGTTIVLRPWAPSTIRPKVPRTTRSIVEEPVDNFDEIRRPTGLRKQLSKRVSQFNEGHRQRTLAFMNLFTREPVQERCLTGPTSS